MNEWDWYKSDQWKRRQKRLPIRSQRILDLRRRGYTVEQKTEWHFRVNGRIDLWPIHNRWHDLETNERGGAKDLAIFVKEHIRHDEIRVK